MKLLDKFWAWVAGLLSDPHDTTEDWTPDPRYGIAADKAVLRLTEDAGLLIQHLSLIRREGDPRYRMTFGRLIGPYPLVQAFIELIRDCKPGVPRKLVIEIEGVEEEFPLPALEQMGFTARADDMQIAEQFTVIGPVADRPANQSEFRLTYIPVAGVLT